MIVGIEMYSPTSRQPVALSYQLTIEYCLPGRQDDPSENVDWVSFGSMDLLIWADVAPIACGLLGHYIEDGHCFAVSRIIGSSKNPDRCTAYRKATNPTSYQSSTCKKTRDEELEKLEKESVLWYAPDSVYLYFQENEPVLAIPNRGGPLKGEQPVKPNSPALPVQGIVVGKVQRDDFYAAKSSFSEMRIRRGVSRLSYTMMFGCSIVRPQL